MAAGRAATAALLVGTTLLAPVVASVLKLHVDRPRQQVVVPLVVETSASFPSGHTLTAVGAYGLLAVVLWQRRHRPVAVLAGTWAGMVAASRVYLGAHYPSDVLASVVYGIGLLVVVALVDSRLRRGWPRRAGQPPDPRALRPAALWERTAAGALTSAAYAVLLGPGLVVLADSAAGQGRLLLAAPLLVAGLVGASAHDLWFVPRHSATVGHLALGLRVVDPGSGRPAGPDEAVTRWALGIGSAVLLVLPLLLAVDLVLVALRPDHRALHDLLAGTAVVRRRPGGRRTCPAGPRAGLSSD